MKLKIRLLEDNSQDFIGDYTLESRGLSVYPPFIFYMTCHRGDGRLDRFVSFGLNVRILAWDVNRLKHFSQPNGRSLLSFRTYFAILSFRCLRFFKLGIISSGFTWLIRPPNEFRTSCSVLNDNGWTTVSSPRAIVQLEFGLISLFGVKFKSISLFLQILLHKIFFVQWRSSIFHSNSSDPELLRNYPGFLLVLKTNYQQDRFHRIQNGTLKSSDETLVRLTIRAEKLHVGPKSAIDSESRRTTKDSYCMSHT